MKTIATGDTYYEIVEFGNQNIEHTQRVLLHIQCFQHIIQNVSVLGQ